MWRIDLTWVPLGCVNAIFQVEEQGMESRFRYMNVIVGNFGTINIPAPSSSRISRT